MFKWACPAVVAAFLAFVGWVLNDMRLEVRRTSRTFDQTGQTVNEHLPGILEKTRKATDALGDDVPDLVEKTRSVTDTLGDVAADVRRLKEALARLKTDRDPELVAYADSVLDCVESSGATVGLKSLPLTGPGLRSSARPGPGRPRRARRRPC
jgi:hypothetical protein